MDDTTIKLLRRSLEANPNDWETRVHLMELLAARGEHSEALTLLNDASDSPAPADEQIAISVANSIAPADANRALEILDTVLQNNKASAEAYWSKAKIYRDRGLVDEARKNYNVAAVINEGFEDDEFEAWLDGKSPPEQPSPNQAPAKPQLVPIGSRGETGDASDIEDEIDRINESDFVETDGDLDSTIASRRPTVSFRDVGGMEALKEQIRMKIIYPFKNQGVFAKFKKKAGGGLLLYGPPGCGKTLMARATAGECGASFISVSISEVLSKWLGESERRLHDIFEQARRQAPSIIFVDELDALGVKRSDASGSMASLVNVMLTEIDGATSENADVLVLGATNTPWLVDSAFRRPGRFDRVIFVPPPDAEARQSILEMLLEDLPTEGIDMRKLAKSAEKFSGADVKHVVESAVESAIAEEMRTGKNVVLTQKMLAKALKSQRPTTLEWLNQASNYASFANQSGLYDDLSQYLQENG